MKKKLSEPIILSRGALLAFGFVNGLLAMIVIVVCTVAFLWASDAIEDVAQTNRERIGELERLERLETPPTEEEVALAAERALRICANRPSCRRRFLLILTRGGDADGQGQNPPGSP